MKKAGFHLFVIHLGNGVSGDDNVIGSGFQMGNPMPRHLFDQTFAPVAYHGIPDLFAHGDADTRWPGRRTAILDHDKLPIGKRLTGLKNPPKIFSLLQTVFPLQ